LTVYVMDPITITVRFPFLKSIGMHLNGLGRRHPLHVVVL
jgi:hypothetical protein